MDASAFAGVSAFWTQADSVGRATAVLLLAMSLATWYLLLVKALQVWRVRRQAAAVMQAFWSAPAFEEAVRRALQVAPASPYSVLAAELASGLRRRAGEPAVLRTALDPRERAASLLRSALARASRRLGAGLGVLASVGATAPFVGLFGTVWGIYHALVAIGFTGQATLDKVAGPVGEALIMTALGIAVAVPAVLAYNFLLRANREIARELEGFAQDLLACTVSAAQARPDATSMTGPGRAADARGGS
jgi:biopolymer transport protein ExbB